MEININLTEARKYLTKLTSSAGEILSNYFATGDFTSRKKGGLDFTTQADEEVDAFLRENIKNRYPQTNFLTEETAPKNYLSLKDAKNLWVIDPLDGTINFSRSHPNFAISIALVDKGKPQLGVAYIPMTKELYWAQEDQSTAYLNGAPIAVSSTGKLGESIIASGWAWDLEKRHEVVKWLNNVCTHVRHINVMGSAVSDLASVANGRIDAYIHSGLKPWDAAASALLIEKAGGRITTSTGQAWDVFQPDLLATNGILHEKILNLINQ